MTAAASSRVADATPMPAATSARSVEPVDRRAILIVNPRAGRGLGAELHDEIAERLRIRWPSLEAVLTEDGDDVERTAAGAAERGLRTFLVVGGDGTLNEVINGVARAPGALAASTFGILPGGTGNDLAGSLGLRTDLEDAVERLRDHGEPRAIDLGVLTGGPFRERLFVNASAGGRFAEASEATSPDAKSLAGRLAYVVGGSRALLDHDGVDVALRAEPPEGPHAWSGRVSMFAVCNAPTVGGGRPFAPFARCDDGWLDAFVVEEAGALGLARVLLQIPGGSHLSDERVVGFRASEIDLRFGRETHVNLDGEVALVDRARYRVLASATRVLVPNEPAERGLSALGEPPPPGECLPTR